MNVLELFAKLSLDTSEYDKSLDTAKSTASGVGSAIGSGLKKAAKIGAAALTTATTAATGFAVSAVNAGKDFDSSMSQVAATLGYSVDELNTAGSEAQKTVSTLNKFAQEMGRTTAFSATQAADALNYMALAGYDAETSMEMLPNVLNLAAAGNMDLARASDMVTDTQTAFGINLERTSQMVDEMAKAASTGNTSVEQLGDAFLVVGGLAKELNGGMVTLDDGTTEAVDGVQELEIALTAMANAGVKGSEAGTHMRNMLLKLSSPTEDGATALENLGLSVFDAEGNMRSLKDIFTDLNAAMDSGAADKLKASYDQLANMQVPLSKVADSYKEWGSLSLVKKNEEGKEVLKTWEEIEAEMGNVITAEGGLTQSEKLSVISDLFNARDVASAEALLAAVNQDWDEIGASILDAQGSAQKMADTQLDNLEGDITLFKSALEGAQIAISDKLTPTLRDFVKFGTDGLSKITGAFQEGGLSGAMEALGEIISDGLDMLVEMLPELVDAGAKLLGALLQGIGENLPKIADTALQIVMDLAGYLLDAIKSMSENGPAIIQGIADWIINAIPNLISTGLDIILGLVDAIINNLPTLITAAVQILVELAKGLIDHLPTLIEAIPKMVQALVDGIVENLPLLVDAAIELTMAIVKGIVENLDLVLAAAVDIIFALIDGIIDALPSLLSQVPRIIIEFVAALIKAYPKVIEGGVKLLGALIKGIVNTIGSLLEYGPKVITEFLTGLTKGFSKLVDAGKSIVDEVKNGFKKKLDDAKNWGKDLMENFIGGIKSKITGLKDTVSNVASNIKDFLGFSEPDKGPLSNFHTYAPDMMQLFAKGISDNAKMLQNTVAKAFDFEDMIETTPTFGLAGAGAGGNMTVNMNIYGAEGQDVRELARLVSDELGNVVKRRQAAW